jgi:hypothetical protein
VLARSALAAWVLAFAVPALADDEPTPPSPSPPPELRTFAAISVFGGGGPGKGGGLDVRFGGLAGPLRLGVALGVAVAGELAIEPAFTLGGGVPAGAARLEADVDLGVAFYPPPDDSELVVLAERTDATTVSIPYSQLRLGVSWIRPSSRTRWTVGAYARAEAREVQQYVEQDCVLIVVCSEQARTKRYGGSSVGLFVSASAQFPPR